MTEQNPLIVFTPSGKRGRFPVGTPVLTAARQLGVDIDSVCGGRAHGSRDAAAAVDCSAGWIRAHRSAPAERAVARGAARDGAALVDYYRSVMGEHGDWDEYRRAMVADGRLLLLAIVMVASKMK